MKYYSTKNKSKAFTLRETVLSGLAEDGGLFMPEFIPKFNGLYNLISNDFPSLAFQILKNFTEEEITLNELDSFCKKAFNFNAPLVQFDNHKFILELFHGPTLAFKDFGARFMALLMGYFAKSLDKELNVLVATSGDTGSAVASGFHNIDGINVYILYPSDKVGPLQEKQLTTYDNNITALEISGTFDDCQTLVKQAFLDKDLNEKMYLTSANSINIARLLPQSIYYFYAYKQLEEKEKPLYFTVPSGNLGNLTAGLIAKKMGLPVTKFIAALNINKVFQDYLSIGKFEPRKAKQTLSNAMDVGNPSNLERINHLFNQDITEIKKETVTAFFDDKETKLCIKNFYQKYNYIIDPHGAIGILAEGEILKNNESNINSIILETASAAKFKDTIDEILDMDINLPERLKIIINKPKQSIKLNSGFEDFKNYLQNKT